MDILRRFFRNPNGNFAITFAIVSVPLFGMAGLALDYSRMVSTRNSAQEAADSAVLAAANEAQELLSQGKSESAALRRGERLGRDFFLANTETLNVKNGSRFSIKLERNGREISGKADFRGKLGTSLMRALTRSDMEINVAASALIGARQFVEVNFVIDNSASMGVGATSADHSIMANTIGCAFACHSPDSASAYGFPSTLAASRSAGATLRIDLVKDTVSKLIDDLTNAGFDGSQLQIGIYSFSNTFKTVRQPTTNVASAKTALAALDMTHEKGEGGTDFYTALSSARSRVGKSGSGLNATSRKKFIVLVSDGVASNVSYTDDENVFGPNPGYRFYSPFYNGNSSFSMQGFDPNACKQIKDRNVTLFTLNVRYIIPTVGTDNDGRFSQIGSYLKPDIQAHMEDCATSPQHALWADTPADMDRARKELIEVLASDILRLDG